MSRKERGIKPYDLAILGKLVTSVQWPTQKNISNELDISQSEVSYGFKALEKIGLIDIGLKKVYKAALKEFIAHSVKFIFPITKSGLSRGFLAGPSSSFFSEKVHSIDVYIWPHEDGDSRGIAINPVLTKISNTVIENKDLYLFLCMVDVYRGLGGIRHLKEAEKYLERFVNEQ